jgi:dTDP-glucose 4,6-dehydratase
MDRGVPGETYNVGGGNEVANIELTKEVLRILGKSEALIQYVTDRPGHDRRYSLDTSKLRSLGWTPQMAFDRGLEATVSWYRDNLEWWQRIKANDPEYRRFHRELYGDDPWTQLQDARQSTASAAP